MPSPLQFGTILLLLALFALQDPPSPKLKTPRTPVPEAARLREAEKTIKDLFKAEYAKKQPADREALAKILLSQAQKSQDDPASQFVLYREAQELAAQIGQVELAFEAVDGAASVFEVDPSAMKHVVLTAVAKTAKSPEELTKVVDGYLALADGAAAADDPDAAEKAAAAAAQAARRSNSAALMVRVTARQKELADLKAKVEKVRRAVEALAKDPNNAAANLEVGLFTCFSKGDWDAGLPFLAKGSDANLKALAARELERPTDAKARADLADGWWDLAEKERNESRQRSLSQRAISHYEKAITEASGLLKAKIEARLDSNHRRILSKEGLEISFVPKPASRGIVLRECGDGLYEPSAAGGKPCLKLAKPDPQDVSRYLYMKVTEAWQEGWKAAEIELEYFDDGSGTVELQYDGAGGAYVTCPKFVNLGNSKTWKVLSSPMVDPQFKGRQNAGADLRIRKNPGGDLYVRRVTIRLVQK